MLCQKKKNQLACEALSSATPSIIAESWLRWRYGSEQCSCHDVICACAFLLAPDWQTGDFCGRKSRFHKLTRLDKKKRGWTSWTPQDLSLEGPLKSSMERRRRLHRSSTASGGLGWFWRWWGLPLLLQWSWCYQHSSQRRVHTRWLFCTLRSHKYTCTVRIVQSCGCLWWESRSPIINRRLLTLLLVDQILNEGLEPLNIECVWTSKYLLESSSLSYFSQALTTLSRNWKEENKRGTIAD